MQENNRNLILVVALSLAVMLAWQYFVLDPRMKAEQAAHQAQLAHQHKSETLQSPSIPGVGESSDHLTRQAALAESGPRIKIDTPTVDGSLVLKGARFNDLRLKRYRETVDPRSPEIVLLAPKRTEFPYYADFGWISNTRV